MPSHPAPNRVEVTLQGTAIGKWVRLRSNFSSGRLFDLGPRNDEPFVIMGGYFPVIIELDAALQIPHLDPDTRVELLMTKKAFGNDVNELDTGQLAITAVCALQAADVPVGECTRMEVRVIKRDG